MNSSEPSMNRYLWASDPASAQIPPEVLIQDRYQVIAPQIWLDTQPEAPPYVPQELPEEIIPYLRLFPQRLHIPEVYGVAVLSEEPNSAEAILLENVPIDPEGNLYPAIVDQWHQTKAVRQVYWLWQILQLWAPLAELGVASSLLIPENIRVQGWRVRLLQLFSDRTDPSNAQPSLAAFSDCWLEWIAGAHPSVLDRLQQIWQQLGEGQKSLDEISLELNQLLLEKAAELPLRLQVAGGTDQGPMRSSNEDSCYPTQADLQSMTESPNDLLIPNFTLVCDGIGGHEGGEVASLMALQTLKLQVRALLIEIAQQTEIVPPNIISEQITAIIRVVNDLIAKQNDSQGREMRQRMGTTLVMGLQIPQKITQSDGTVLENAHELYIASVGDSRVYWITADYCQQLTIDDDVATREVRLGRSLYREALRRVDGGALTQALGTREAQILRPSIGRFILEEDGILLLCSDGLSDRNTVEQSWQEFAKPVLKNKMTLEAAVQSWIDLANEKNGHDNTSVVLTRCLLSPEPPVLFEPRKLEAETPTTPYPVESELTEASKALLYSQATQPEAGEIVDVQPVRQSSWLTVLTTLGIIVVFGFIGLGVWRSLTPQDTPPTQETPANTNE
ncbi:serine/threonine-protein phosphatase [Aerosakkonemataceae cyanobacterium BLCC-F50]|uniref:Serine/threonine-protein phosphatase n=1 Tax=Floridaenema flaviceps BLCC-F50 TaxID=3153642 RepID=A0ABV4XQW6_9CYAN